MPFDSTPQTDPVLQRLRDARAKLAQGWVQGREFYREVGQVSYCMIGAVARDDDGNVVAEPATWVALDLVSRVLQGRHIADYNDAPGRTLAQVLATMDAAIRRCEEKTHAI